jgi:replicative DNA helicase
MAKGIQNSAQTTQENATLANREAEQALVGIIIGGLDADKQRLCRLLSTGDFYYQDTRFAFGEYQKMLAAGVPGDAAGLTSWYRRPETLERMTSAGLDDFVDAAGVLNPGYMLLEIIRGGEFATTAHVDWYIGELRRWRKSRGLQLVAAEIAHRVANTPNDPDSIIEWVSKQVARLSGLSSNGNAKPMNGAGTNNQETNNGKNH